MKLLEIKSSHLFCGFVGGGQKRQLEARIRELRLKFILQCSTTTLAYRSVRLLFIDLAVQVPCTYEITTNNKKTVLGKKERKKEITSARCRYG